jgi:methyl-accepting chemotaxis protein
MSVSAVFRSWSGRSIRTRLLALVGLGVVGMGVVVVTASGELRDAQIEARRDTMTEHVESAVAVLAHFQAMEVEGLVSREEAQQRAHDTLTAMTFGDSGYFFAWDHQAFDYTVLGPKPELEGVDLDGADPEPLLRAITAAVDEGDGFHSYEFPKPGEEDPSPKLAFAASFAPWDWTVGTGAYVDDIDALVASQQLRLWTYAALAALVVAGVALLITRSITGPVDRIRDSVRTLATGDLDVDVPDVAIPEVSAMATAVRALVAYLDDIATAADRVAHGDLRTQVGSRGERDRLGVAFAAMIDSLRRTVDVLRDTSEHVATAANELDGVTQSVSASAEQTSAQTNHVAVAADELRCAIGDIAQSTTDASRVTSDAVIAVGTARERIGALDTSSRRITEVVELISGVAEQTNLLALNATIEAARAGESGKGFAVVADEVKALSRKVTDMTEEIRRRIEGVAAEVAGGVASIDDIEQVTSQLGELTATIAAAVEEQSAIAATIGENATGVAEAAQSTATSSTQTSASAAQLTAVAHDMDRLVGDFQLPSRADGAPQGQVRSVGGSAPTESRREAVPV